MNNIITEDDVVGGQAFIDEFVRRKDLPEEVELGDEQVKTFKGFKKLAEKLRSSNVKLITVAETHLGFIQGYDSQTFIERVNHVKSDTWKSLVVVEDNFIGDKGAKAIAENLKSLTDLSLNYNHIGDEGAKAIAENLKSLTGLGLNDNNIGDEGAVAIAENLKSLTTLGLEFNYIGVQGAKAIAENLKSLTALDLGGNNIGDEGAVAIAENLKSLTTLGLNYNHIGDEGAKAIAENLTSLTTLYLNYNRIGDEGAKAIAENLTSFTTLYLNYNRIGDEGAKAIAENLTSLTTLYLGGNNIGVEGAKAIANGNLMSLTTLYLGGKNIGVEVAKAIANGNLTSLTALDGVDDFNSNLAMLRILVQQGGLEKKFSIIKLDKENAMALVNVWKMDPEKRFFEIPENVFDSGPDAITSYVGQLIKGSSFEVKLMILGDANAGKTSLIQSILENGKDRRTSKDARTIGIEYKDWMIELENEEKLAVHLQDFGGQETYHQLHRLYIPGQSPSLIVFDLSLFPKKSSLVEEWVRKSIIYYIEAVRSQVQEAQFFLIVTHYQNGNLKNLQWIVDILNKHEILEQTRREEILGRNIEYRKVWSRYPFRPMIYPLR